MKNSKVILIIFVLLTMMGGSQLALADAAPKGQRDAVVDKYPGNGGFPHGEESYPIGDVGNTSNGNSGGGVGNTGPGNMGNDKLVGNVGTASTGGDGNGGGNHGGGSTGGNSPDMKECPKKAQGKPCNEGSITIPPRVGNPGDGNFGNEKLVGGAREKRKCPGQHVCGGEGGGGNGNNNGGAAGGGNGGLIVQIETAGDGSGSVITDLTLQAGDRQTFYAVLRTPKGKYLRPATDVTWDIGDGTGFVVVEQSSGGSSGGAFITIEAQIVGTGSISMNSKFGSHHCSFTITPGEPYYIVIETRADGTGLPLIELPPLTAGSGGIDLYNCIRDKYGNFIGTVDDAVWEYTGDSGGSEVFTAIEGGVNFNPTIACSDCELTLSYGGLHGGSIGQIIVLPGAPTNFTVELTPDCNGNLFEPNEIIAGERTEFYICSRDAYGNFVQLIEDTGAFSFVYSDTEELASSNFGSNGNGGFYFEVYEACGCRLSIRYPDYPIYIYKTAIAPNIPTQISIEDKTNGDGLPIDSLTYSAGDRVVLYAVARDDWGNYVDNVYVNWSLSNELGSISPTTGSYYTIYQAQKVGYSELEATNDSLRSDMVNLSTISGPAYKLTIEDQPDGSGQEINSLELTAGDQVSLYSLAWDQFGNFIGTFSGNWSSENSIGQPAGTFSPTGPNISPVFEAQRAGNAFINLNGTSMEGDSLAITIHAADPEGLVIQDASGNQIVDLFVGVNQSVDFYAYSADSYGNAISPIEVQWSLTGIAGVITADNTSTTTFTPTEEGVGTISILHDSFGEGAISIDTGTPLITFEDGNAPGFYPVNGMEINTQFAASHGIIFSTENGSIPRLAMPGKQFPDGGCAYQSPCNASDSGNMLFPGFSFGDDALIIHFVTPVSSSTGDILDVELWERVYIDALDVNGQIIESKVLAGPGNLSRISWNFEKETAIIDSLRLRTNRTGWALDNISGVHVISNPTDSNLIVNGSFEIGPIGNYARLGGDSTEIEGWITTLSGTEWFAASNYSWEAADGQFAVDLANYRYNGGGIKQVIHTQPGQYYRLSFFAATSTSSGRDGTGTVDLLIDGIMAETYSLENYSVPLVWNEYSYTFQAVDQETTLEFQNNQDANYHFAIVDDVSVVRDGFSGTPAASLTCASILNEDSTSPSGYYTVDPDGSGGLSPFEAYCDMETLGGGWMLVAYHADGVVPVEVTGAVRSDTYGVMDSIRWQTVNDLLTEGLMTKDEFNNVAFISVDKLYAPNCTSLQNSKKIGGVSSERPLPFWHAEESGCNAKYLDYSYVAADDSSIRGAAIAQRSSVKFDIWPYTEEMGVQGSVASYNIQNEMWYFIK